MHGDEQVTAGLIGDLATLPQAHKAVVLAGHDHDGARFLQELTKGQGHPKVDLGLPHAGGAALVTRQVSLSAVTGIQADLQALQPPGIGWDGVTGLGKALPDVRPAGGEDAAGAQQQSEQQHLHDQVWKP